MITLREKLIKVGARVVRHDRYITFQLAEVAIPRTLFAEILGLIDGLRPAQHTPVLLGDLDATGWGAVMAVKALAAARQ